MAKNQRYTHSNHIALTVPDGVKSGDPVVVGQIAGVAQTDRGADGRATVWTNGSYLLNVGGAVTEGQAVFKPAASTTLTTTASGNAFFGVAVVAAAGAGLAEIAPAGIVKP